MLFLSCNFSHLVSCHIGLETWIPKGGQRVLSFTAKVITGVCFISFFSGSIFARRGARSKGGFSWVRFFLVGVGWIGLGVLGMKKFARIPVLDSLVFRFLFKKRCQFSFFWVWHLSCLFSFIAESDTYLAVTNTPLMTTILQVFMSGIYQSSFFHFLLPPPFFFFFFWGGGVGFLQLSSDIYPLYLSFKLPISSHYPTSI